MLAMVVAPTLQATLNNFDGPGMTDRRIAFAPEVDRNERKANAFAALRIDWTR
jgi:hypothetical protein